MLTARLATLVSLAIGPLVAGCGHHATPQQLRARAANELGCPADNLRVRDLDEHRRWVAGCGKSRTYAEECGRNDQGHDDCTWQPQPDEATE
jgi:hypothetical protein